LCIKPVTLGTSSSALLDFMPMVLYWRNTSYLKKLNILIFPT
jgi:hypothetical protein